MDFYALIQHLSAKIASFIVDGGFSRLVDRAPSRLAALANSDAALQGISTAQTVSAVLSALFAFFLVLAVIKKRQLSVRPDAATGGIAAGAPARELSTGPLRARWEVVRTHLESPHEAEWKLAVMDADKLVDDALAKAGFPGDTFGDRLTNIQPGTLISLDGIWWAHRIRNRLAHELDYFLRYTEARQAVGYYEQALTELQLL